MSFTIYTTEWCRYCVQLKKALAEAGITDYTEVDIEATPEAVTILQEANGGRKTVPTVIFADGTAIINPPLAEIKKRL